MCGSKNRCCSIVLVVNTLPPPPYSLDSRRRSSSTGLMNFSQSCVPLGTMRSSCSATTIPRAYDRLLLLIVVMKREPPGCKGNKNVI